MRWSAATHGALSEAAGSGGREANVAPEMDEVRQFCIRMLGDGPAAADAERAAREAGPGRLAGLTAAVGACRRAGAGGPGADGPGAREGAADRREEESVGGPGPDLAAAVARELAAASARLAPAQREVLALRELVGLSHSDIAAVTGTPEDEVPLRLAWARLELRAQLRGRGAAGGGGGAACFEQDRALRTITLRQDDEPVPAADDEWLMDHLGHCPQCAAAHAGVLEASVRYRAWRMPTSGAEAGAAHAAEAGTARAAEARTTGTADAAAGTAS